MNRNKILNILTIAFLLMTLTATAIVFFQLPATVPIHWNIRGEIDGTGPRGTVWITPGIQLFIAILFQCLTHAIAKDEKQRFSFQLMGFALAGFFFTIQCLILAAGLNYRVDMTRWMGLGLSLMFMLFGLAMKDLPRNGLAGIRAPWTMKSDEAWAITHRRAAWLVTIGSGVGAAVSLVNGFAGALISIIALLYTLPYSYLATRKL